MVEEQQDSFVSNLNVLNAFLGNWLFSREIRQSANLWNSNSLEFRITLWWEINGITFPKYFSWCTKVVLKFACFTQSESNNFMLFLGMCWLFCVFRIRYTVTFKQIFNKSKQKLNFRYVAAMSRCGGVRRSTR